MSAMPAQLGDNSRSIPGKSVALRSPHDGIVCMIERQSWGAVEVEGNSGRSGAPIRRDWERAEAEGVYAQPFAELLFQAQTVHRGNCDPNYVETASLLGIKTDGCPEDCAYCAQSVHYDTGLKATRLMDRADVVAAQRAKAAGASRVCMAAAWRSAKDRDLDQVCDIIAAVKRVGMETCVTLGMLTPKQAARLADAGVDFYNHHVDTSPEFYRSIITTRPCKIGSTLLRACARWGSKSAAAALLAWVSTSMTVSACWFCSPMFPTVRKAYRSTCGTR